MEESAFHYPQGLSATHFQVVPPNFNLHISQFFFFIETLLITIELLQGGPAFQHHFGFLQSSPTGNYLQQGHRLSDDFLLIPFWALFSNLAHHCSFKLRTHCKVS